MTEIFKFIFQEPLLGSNIHLNFLVFASNLETGGVFSSVWRETGSFEGQNQDHGGY